MLSGMQGRSEFACRWRLKNPTMSKGGERCLQEKHGDAGYIPIFVNDTECQEDLMTDVVPDRLLMQTYAAF